MTTLNKLPVAVHFDLPSMPACSGTQVLNSCEAVFNIPSISADYMNEKYKYILCVPGFVFKSSV